MKNTLFASLVLSPVAHAKLVSIDSSEALKQKGVLACLTAKDVPDNKYELLNDGVFLADDEVRLAQTSFSCFGV